jgi:hypothetical protein
MPAQSAAQPKSKSKQNKEQKQKVNQDTINWGKRQSIFGREDELKTAPKGVAKDHP